MLEYCFVKFEISKLLYQTIGSAKPKSQKAEQGTAEVSQSMQKNEEYPLCRIETKMKFSPSDQSLTFEIECYHTIAFLNQEAFRNFSKPDENITARILYDVITELNEALRKMGILLQQPIGIQGILRSEEEQLNLPQSENDKA